MSEFRWSPVPSPGMRISARLKERTDGGPMRTALDVSQKRAVGRYASQKNGRGQFWESRNELRAFYRAEVSTQVIKYRAQPHTLELALAGKLRRYTPDRMDFLIEGGVEIIEVKETYKADKDPDYADKLRAAALVYSNLGWSFRIITSDEIEAQPSFSAVVRIQNHRRTVITPRDEDITLDLLSRHGTAALADVRALWPNPAIGFAKMCALMIKRSIHIDYNSGLRDMTPVNLVAQ